MQLGEPTFHFKQPYPFLILDMGDLDEDKWGDFMRMNSDCCQKGYATASPMLRATQPHY